MGTLIRGPGATVNICVGWTSLPNRWFVCFSAGWHTYISSMTGSPVFVQRLRNLLPRWTLRFL